MSFTDAVRALANQIETRREHVHTEEAAKQALILPFIALLGFDIYNPAEVIPEYKAGWAKVSEKVDYALLIAKRLSLFVEAKGINEVLVNHDPQLAKYFNSTPEVKFSIITNGVQYRFFTDLQEKNILDKKPFFEFNFGDFADSDIAVLERFRKEVFNVESLVGYAEDLVFLSGLKAQFKSLLRDPSDDFVRFAVVAAELVDGRVTQRVVDRFRPLVKESISAAILEIVGQSFLQTPAASVEIVEDNADTIIEEPAKKGIETTEEELRVFEIVKRLLADQVPDPDKLRHQDTHRYFAVLYGGPHSWFARMITQGAGAERKMLCFRLSPDRLRELAPNAQVDEPPTWMGTSRITFSDVAELEQLQDAFVAAVKDLGA